MSEAGQSRRLLHVGRENADSAHGWDNAGLDRGRATVRLDYANKVLPKLAATRLR